MLNQTSLTTWWNKHSIMKFIQSARLFQGKFRWYLDRFLSASFETRRLLQLKLSPSSHLMGHMLELQLITLLVIHSKQFTTSRSYFQGVYSSLHNRWLAWGVLKCTQLKGHYANALRISALSRDKAVSYRAMRHDICRQIFSARTCIHGCWLVRNCYLCCRVTTFMSVFKLSRALFLYFHRLCWCECIIRRRAYLQLVFLYLIKSFIWLLFV